MLVLHVVGARPNFMKLAPVHAAIGSRGVRQQIIHTGQHYDAAMSGIFFEELRIPAPDVNLNVGSGSHSKQTAEVMMRIEPVFQETQPAWVLVYGDVNSTVAAALVCAKLRIRVGHVEAGLRSRDRDMPEEINRIVTDHIADLLFTPSADADENLIGEGIERSRIRLVGNVMVDTLLRLLPAAEDRWTELRARFGFDRYALVTLHRPSNVDDPDRLQKLVRTLGELSASLPVIFPIHPRTRGALNGLGYKPPSTLVIADPLGYLDFIALQRHARLVVTDSGGIQEESTVLGVPCLTTRDNTERPVTITHGTNRLIGSDMSLLRIAFMEELARGPREVTPPPLWDGRAGERIASEIVRISP